MSLADAVKGCQEILDGFYDDVDEAKFQYIGSIDVLGSKPAEARDPDQRFH